MKSFRNFIQNKVITEDSKIFNQIEDICFSYGFGKVNHAFIEHETDLNKPGTLDIMLTRTDMRIDYGLVQNIRIISKNFKGKFNKDKDVKLNIRLNNNTFAGFDNDMQTLKMFVEECNNINKMIDKINTLKLMELDNILTR